MYSIEHKYMRGIKYIKNRKNYDITSYGGICLQNIVVMNSRNKYNILQPSCIVSKLSGPLLEVYKSSLNYNFGFMGGFTTDKKTPDEILRLKIIIKYRLENYYSKRGLSCLTI